MAFVGVPQQRQKRTGAVIDTVPADAERSVPLCAAGIDKASAAADSGIVEQKMDTIGGEIACYGFGECQHLIFDRDIGHECRYPRTLPRLRHAKLFGFSHGLSKHIADSDVTAHSHQLKRQLTPHAGVVITRAGVDEGEQAVAAEWFR